MQIAQTPVALFSQMFEQGRADAEIDLVRRAYDLGVELYSARFEADGSPFQVHGVGTARILAHLGRPAWVLAAACIHNVYGTALRMSGLRSSTSGSDDPVITILEDEPTTART